MIGSLLSRKLRLISLYGVARTLCVIAALFYVVGKMVSDWPAVRALDVHWTLLDPSLAIVSALAAYLLLVFGWMAILREIGLFRRVFWGYYFRIWFVSYVHRHVPGKVLLLTERARLGRQVGIDPLQGAYIAVLETVLVVGAAMIFSIPVIQSAMEFGVAWTKGAAVLLTLLAIGAVAWKNLHRLPYFRERVASLVQTRMHPRRLVIPFLVYLLFWLLIGLSFFFLIRVFEPLPFHHSLFIIGLFALAYALGVVAVFAPGGVGVREVVLTVGLSSIMPEGSAAAIALASRICLTLLELALLSVVLLMIPIPEAAETRN